MNSPPSDRPFSAPLAFGFELSLGLLAVLLGWFFGWSPTRSLEVDGLRHLGELVGWGLAATAPMLVMLALIERYPIGPLRGFRQTVHREVAPLFRGCGVAELAALSVAAGVGEELLFRGLVQGGLAHWFGGDRGVWTALLAGGLLFGVCHWLTNTYAVLATLIGVYLGAVFIACDHLLPTVIAHALYDFIALLYLVRFAGGDRSTEE